MELDGFCIIHNYSAYCYVTNNHHHRFNRLLANHRHRSRNENGPEGGRLKPVSGWLYLVDILPDLAFNRVKKAGHYDQE